MNTKYNFKISVVIPVYNVEDYLDETIKSVVNQTIGIKNIQIILINDGATDKSGDICLKYKEKYSDNVVYIEQQNAGVSAARNNGMKYIKGKYICFLDSDDKWEKHSFKRVYDFFEKHYEEIDIVDCRVRHFDAQNNYYIFDKRYGSTRIVDTNIEYEHALINTATTILKSEAIKGITFDTNLKYSEDTKFINEVLLRKCKFGIKHDALYLYRKRRNGTSAVDKRLEEKAYFTGPLKNCFSELVNKALNMYDEVPMFLQHLILRNLSWRIKLGEVNNVLDQKELSDYRKNIDYLLSFVSDEIIATYTMPLNNKMYFFAKKKGNDFLNKITIDKNNLIIDNKCYEDVIDMPKITITKMKRHTSDVTIYGKVRPIVNTDEFKLSFVDSDNNKYVADVFSQNNWTINSFDNEVISKCWLFKVVIPFEGKKKKVSVNISYKGNLNYNLELGYVRLSNKYKSYLNIDNELIVQTYFKTLDFEAYSRGKLFKYYVSMLFDLLFKRKLKTFIKKLIIEPFICIKPLKNIIIMESNPAFADNTKPVFDKLIEHGVNKKYKIVWFVDDADPFKNVKIDNVEFIQYFNNPKKPLPKRSEYSKNCHKNAKIIIDNNRYLDKKNKKQLRIHLLHGSPIKNAYSYNLDVGNVDYVVNQAEFFKAKDTEVRDIDANKIKSLGFARNDIVYSKANVEFKFIDELDSNKIILWLPTYRNHKAKSNGNSSLKFGLPCIDSLEELKDLNQRLKKDKIFIIIKFHPAENTNIFRDFNFSNILILTDEELKNNNIGLYQLFNKVDALLTDYSSVYFDFAGALPEKNIGLAISDFDDYVKNSGEFVYPYKDVFIGDYLYTNSDLLQFIDDVSKGKDKSKSKRKKLTKRYDDYRDGQSAERVYDLLKKYL